MRNSEYKKTETTDHRIHLLLYEEKNLKVLLATSNKGKETAGERPRNVIFDHQQQ